MDETMNPLYILGWPLGYVMEWIYKLIPNYGWDIILFTLLITVIKIPLQLNQQKSMARMSAFQPMVAEIQKKYRDKPEKQQEELMKLQEQGYKPTAGCMPMLVNFLVVFGVIEVVYRPLQRIFHIGADALTAAGEALTAMGISFTTVTRDTNIIAQVIAGESTVSFFAVTWAGRSGRLALFMSSCVCIGLYASFWFVISQLAESEREVLEGELLHQIGHQQNTVPAGAVRRRVLWLHFCGPLELSVCIRLSPLHFLVWDLLTQYLKNRLAAVFFGHVLRASFTFCRCLFNLCCCS